MKRLFILFAAFIVFSHAIFAQDKKDEGVTQFRRFDIGYLVLSYERRDQENLTGGALSFTTYVNQRVGIVADLAIHTPRDNGSLQYIQYRFGPKLYWFHAGRVSTFGEFIAGGSRIEDNFGNHIDGLALAAGGGMDLRIKQWFSWRAFQSDYSFFRITGENSNGVRIGTGIVFRFGE